MSWLPERLVTIAEYAAPELAGPERARLEAAGISSSLGGRYYRRHGLVELQVSESEAARARTILGLDAEAPSADAPVPAGAKCPDCGSEQGRRIPPYAFYALVGSMGLGLLWSLLARSPIGMVMLLPGWFLAVWLSRLSGKWRCAACGRTWKP
jgi:hypothetical protein